MVSDHPPQCFLLLLTILKYVANEFSPRLVNFCFYFKSGFLGITLELALLGGQHRRRQWQLTPVLLPGKSHGWRNLVGCSPWGREESNMTKQLHFHFSLSCIGEGNGNPLQYSCLENPRGGGAWWAAVHGAAQSQTRLKRLSSSSSCSGQSMIYQIFS